MATIKDTRQQVNDEHYDDIASSGTSAKKVILIDTNGVPYNAAGGGGSNDGAILDGVSSSIKATVLDYTNSNPLAVRMTDTNGDYVSAGGGGEQYTDGTAVHATYKGTLVLGTDGSNYQIIGTNSDGDVKITLDSEVVATTSIANSTATGTITAAGQTVECVVSAGAGTVGCQLTGTWAAAGDLVRFEATTDGTNWVSVYTSMGVSAVIVTGQNGIYQLGAAGYVKVRVIGLATWNAGTCTINFNSTVGPSAVVISTPLPQGTNILGKVGIDQTTPGTTNNVTVSAMPVVHTITDSGTTIVTQGTGTNLHAVVDSGAVTVSQGTGTNLHTVVDSGAITATGSGNFTVIQGTGTNLHTVVDSGTITTITNVVHVDDNSSTLTVDQGTASNLKAEVYMKPDNTSTYAPTNATTTAYAASLVVKASAGKLLLITGYNSKTSDQFIQVHDAASLPADTTVPKLVFLVPAQNNFSLDLGTYGRYFATGIVVCNSSTGPTKTIGSADCWIDVQYV